MLSPFLLFFLFRSCQGKPSLETLHHKLKSPGKVFFFCGFLSFSFGFCTVTQCQSSIESSSRNMVGITFHRWQLNVLASGYTSDLRTGLQRIQRSLDRRKGKKRKAGILSISNEADHSFRRALVRAKTRQTLHTCVPGDEGETRARRPARKEEL